MKYLVCALLLAVAGPACAQAPSLLAKCTRSANLLACVDPLGNAYSVATVGTTTVSARFRGDRETLLGHKPTAATGN